MKTSILSNLAAACALFATTVSAQSIDMQPGSTGPSEQQVKEWALEAIMEDPSIILRAVQAYENEQALIAEQNQAAALMELAPELRKAYDAYTIGNPDGDVTIVEFFDYNCPHCRNSAAQLEALFAQDGDVRVVLREFPVLSEKSVEVAKISLAAGLQGKYEEFHTTAMKSSQLLDRSSAIGIAANLGLNIDRLVADAESPEVQAHIDRTAEYADQLRLTGTPAFVIGDRLIPGAASMEQMANLVDEAREEGLDVE